MLNLLDLVADGVFVTHGVFMILAIPSTLLALFGFYRARMHFFHFHNFCMGVMVWGRVTFGRCPLVELEERLRDAAGTQMAYKGSYVEHVMMQIGVDMPKSSVLYISVSIAVFTAVALILHFVRPRADDELAPEPVTVAYQ
jgi:hypothetical protein